MAFQLDVPKASTSRPSQEVHIAALGWEHDRIVMPFLSQNGKEPAFRPHRLVLVVAGRSGAEGFDTRIKESLEGVCTVEVEEVDRNKGDKLVAFENVLERITKVMAREILAGNRVFINISGGSKLEAFASGLAAMTYLEHGGGSFYYVEPENYAKDDPKQEGSVARKRGMGIGFKSILNFPPIPIGAPLMRRTAVLRHLWDNPKKHSPHEILRALKEVPIADLQDLDFESLDARRTRYIGGTRKEDAKARMRLKRGFLDDLEKEGYIEVKALGKKRFVTLTTKGEIYARMAPSWELFRAMGVP